MKELVLICLSLVSTVISIESEDIKPCTIQPISEIHCSGPEITNTVLSNVAKKTGNAEFHTLLIQNTELTEIEKNLFSQTIFDNIYIDNNQKLVKIDSHAFKPSPALQNLFIVNNHELSDNNIFSLARNLNPTENIVFIGNAITEIPANAFAANHSNSKLKSISLNNNKIEKVGENAFTGLTNLLQITLHHNRIQNLNNNSLKLDYSKNGEHDGLVFIFLNSNNLTASSFTPKTFGDIQQNAISLDLENNLIHDLPEPIFKPLIEPTGSVVYVYNNEFNCSCSLKWILEKTPSQRIQGLYCANIKKSIHGLNQTELGCH